MFQGYFDESGSFEQAPKIFAISGYFLTSDAAKAMDQGWARVLLQHGIPYFRMAECAHGNGVFTGKPVEERIEISKKCIDLIKRYTAIGFSVIARAETFDKDEPDIYSYCAEIAAVALQVFIRFCRVEGKLAFFFEAGHRSQGRAYSRVADHFKHSGLATSLRFAAKQEVRLLQAADLLAWQSTKYAKDRLSNKRAPRKDFLSLMEHPHDFYHISIENGEKSLGVEAWPLSRRSRTTTHSNLDTSGVFSVISEEGEELPIIPIEATTGVREGGGRMTYVAFQDMGQKKFALAFDDVRLLEAAGWLVAATAFYADTRAVLMFPASSLSLDPQAPADTVAIRVQLPNGGRIALKVSREEFDRFMKEARGD